MVSGVSSMGRLSTAEQTGVYGLVNGLGYAGDPAERARIIRSAQRAADRGDWEHLLGMGAAYLLGVAIGSAVRQAGSR